MWGRLGDGEWLWVVRVCAQVWVQCMGSPQATRLPSVFHLNNRTYGSVCSIAWPPQTFEWLEYANYDNHYYATQDASRRPVRFMEHQGAGKLKQWDFVKYTVGAPRDLFEPPAPGTCSEVCESYACKTLRTKIGP